MLCTDTSLAFSDVLEYKGLKNLRELLKESFVLESLYCTIEVKIPIAYVAMANHDGFVSD